MVASIANRVKEVSTHLRVGRTIRLLWSLSKRMTCLLVFMVMLEVTTLYGSIYAVKLLIDLVTMSSKNLTLYVDQISTQLLIAAALAVAYHIIKAISAYVTEVQATTVSELINDKMHEKTINLDLSFYEQPAYFDILQRAKNAGADRPTALIISILDTAKQTLGLLVIASIVINIDWVLLPLLVLFIVPTLFMRIHFSNKLNLFRIKTTPLERSATYFSQLITSESSAKEIRSYDLGDYFKNKSLNIRLQLLAERLKIAFSRTKGEILTGTLASLGLFACTAYTINHALEGKVTIGDITVFLLVFPQIFNFLQGISAGISAVYHNNIFINSIYELLDLKSPERITSLPSVQTPETDSLTLKFADVSFKYPHMDKPTLKNINLEIPAGKIVALVGMNGAGKSTLIKLMTRLYNPTSGAIMLNQQDVQNFTEKDYRKLFGVVFQDFCRYHVSVAENISLGDIYRGTHDLQNIEQAAVQSGAHGFISDFRYGYQTMMGRIFDDGSEVSIGQWQKLAVARALYGRRPFLIFDEATSALDAMAEQDFFSMLTSQRHSQGILVISHRYSSIKHADYIYVLKEGKVVQEGTFAELSNVNGDFLSLFKEEIINEAQF